MQLELKLLFCSLMAIAEGGVFMKTYIKPTFECIQIRPEERLATCTREGYCVPLVLNDEIIFVTLS